MFIHTKQVLQSILRAMGLAIAAIVIATCAACGGGGGGGESGGSTNSATLTAVGSPSSTPSVSQPLVVGLEASRVTGVAPLSVFFDASATTALSTSKPFHDLRYQWNFGDPASGTWSNGNLAGSSSKNLASGPVASHLFETPGTYNVTVQVNDNTYSTAKTVQITVQDPEVVFAANTVCFSSTGNFVGCPSGGMQVSTSNFKTAIETYQATKKRLLFRAGEAFTSTGSHTYISTSGPGYIGKFGTGAAPKFTTTSTTAFLFLSLSTTPTIKDWRIVDLELDGQNGSVGGINFQGGIDQVTLLRLNIHNIKYGLNNSPDLLNYWNSDANVSNHGHRLWDQLAVIDSQIVMVNGGVASAGLIGAYLSGMRLTMMGCTVDPAYGGEHAVRNPYIDRGVISHNYMARPANTKHSWTLRGADQSNSGLTGAGKATQKVLAAENVFFNDISAWTVTVAPTNTLIDERIQDVVVERNYFVGGTATQIALVSRGSTKNLSVRHNIINITGNTSYATAMSISGSADIVVPQSTGHIIVNNTVYRSDAASSAIGVMLGSNAANYTIKNNLVYAPLASSITVINGTLDGGGLVTGRNSSTAQATTSPLFQTTPSGNTLVSTDFKPTTGSYAINTGDYIPVFEDIFRVTRTGTYSIGAVQP